ncbi:phospholipase A [Parendozoicomonas haliclonae]|uniref:Phospholipase A1 n=1 Tax=Parendozoicomonas haliclonae TaxID=1960125 RepID=A0A1X7AIL3_9GAMM|nr:phospholipase A [Parendozoicomonas haliclonae]SMA45446.1 Phospholipase A1 precursor [Parendozoicomonas haliclonae]
MKVRTANTLAAAIAVTTAAFASMAQANPQVDSTQYQQCIMEHLATAAPDTTVSELKARCESLSQSISVAASEQPAEQTQTPFEHRYTVEHETRDELFVLQPHKPNYLLPISHSFSRNYVTDGDQTYKLDSNEVQFQISLKTPVAQGLFHENGDLYFAYTNRSWWQAYNSDISSPFRETNHEPEVFYSFTTDHDLFGMKVRNLTLGLSHQSNGKGGDRSRSWNRVYASVLMEKGNFYLHLKPWFRLKEKEKDYVGDPNGDDNPDINKYMGNGELSMFYKFSNEHSLSLMLRNNLRKDNKGAAQLGWSFPLPGAERLRGYVQYFNGYGESLVDYNESVSRLSIGFMLTDWL